MPGFVNTHSHLMGCLQKGPDRGSADRVGRTLSLAMPLQRKYIKPEEVYWPAMHARARAGANRHHDHQRGLVVRARGGEDRPRHRGYAPSSPITSASTTLTAASGIQERRYDVAEGQRAIEASLAFIDRVARWRRWRITCKSTRSRPTRARRKTLLLQIKDLAEKRGLGYNVHLARFPRGSSTCARRTGRARSSTCTGSAISRRSSLARTAVFMSPAEWRSCATTGAHMSHTAYLVGKRGYLTPMDEIYRQACRSPRADGLSTDVFKIMRAAIILGRHQARSAAV